MTSIQLSEKKIDELCESPEEQEKMTRIWGNIKTWEDLLTTNVRFIRGELIQTPYHFGPLLEDSQLLANELISLHNYGIFSVDGQGPDIELSQRPYIDFYIQNTKLNMKFINEIAKDPNLITVSMDMKNGEILHNISEYCVLTGVLTNPYTIMHILKPSDYLQYFLYKGSDYPNIVSLVKNSICVCVAWINVGSGELEIYLKNKAIVAGLEQVYNF